MSELLSSNFLNICILPESVTQRLKMPGFFFPASISSAKVHRRTNSYFTVNNYDSDASNSPAEATTNSSSISSYDIHGVELRSDDVSESDESPIDLRSSTMRAKYQSFDLTRYMFPWDKLPFELRAMIFKQAFGDYKDRSYFTWQGMPPIVVALRQFPDSYSQLLGLLERDNNPLIMESPSHCNLQGMTDTETLNIQEIKLILRYSTPLHPIINYS